MTRRSVTTVTFRVKMRLPPGVSVETAKRYVHDAVGSWKGQLSDQSPLAAVDRNELIVTIGERKTVYL